MRILVDMDGVIADLEKSILDIYRSLHPDKFFIPLDERNSFYVKKQYPDELKPLIDEIRFSKGFYLNIKPVEGSLEALSEMSSRGYKVYICTSPSLSNPSCIQEKYGWVSNHLGKYWTEKMILSRDKTIIQGDLLIDDKPSVTGAQEPTWEHILYSQPYNAHVNSKKRITWKNWESVINS